MRFAYIDSQGNEVAIPSVDALALRIELGAIRPDTELYDAQADRWGPARSHEIFHSLARKSEGEGFVAPPPPVAPPADESEEAAPSGGGTPPEPADDGPTMDLEDLAPDAPEEGEAEAGVPAGGEEDFGMPRFDLSEEFLAADEPAEGEPSPPEPRAPAPAPDDDLGLDLTLADEDPTPAAEPPEVGSEATEKPAGPPSGSAPEETEEEDAPFDFGGVEMLEMEEPEEEPGAGDPEEPEAEDEEPFDLDGGMQLEEPLADQDSFEDVSEDASGGLELERPMSEFDADAPPAWMEQEGPGAPDSDDDVDVSPADEEKDREAPAGRRAPSPDRADRDERLGEGPEPREAPRPPRREPRSRPSPPRRKPERSWAGPLVGLVAVVALGAGGWFGWQALQGGGGGSEAPVLPPVTIPDIPAELLPVMRDLGEQALAGTVAEMEELAAQAGLPDQPRQDWLSGVYLANAGQYPDIEEYWLGVESLVARIQDQDREIFHREYQEALAAEGISGDTAALLLERADSGFLATRQQRFEAYAEMGDLVNAALNLHEFLLVNEAEIDYDPAAGGMSADPVLEAVPSTPELGDEMWDRVDRITAALDQLGTLDRVTTERLLAVLFDRIRRAGFE